MESNIGSYIIGKTIGEGTFGRVKLGVHKETNQLVIESYSIYLQVAIKIIEKEKIIEPVDIERVKREIKILQLLNHPYIVQLYEIIEDQQSIYLIMEYASGGELFDYIVKNTRIKENEAQKLIHQIIAGIQYIHQLGIAHRDLKPENLLLTPSLDILIVDFGLSNLYSENGTLSTACGSPCYAAPEMIAGHPYRGSQTDIWSIGVIMFALLCGYLPFEDENIQVLYKKIMNAEFHIPRFVSADGKDLIKSILTVDANKRFTFEQIKAHKWWKFKIPQQTDNKSKLKFKEVKCNMLPDSIYSRCIIGNEVQEQKIERPDDDLLVDQEISCNDQEIVQDIVQQPLAQDQEIADMSTNNLITLYQLPELEKHDEEEIYKQSNEVTSDIPAPDSPVKQQVGIIEDNDKQILKATEILSNDQICIRTAEQTDNLLESNEMFKRQPSYQRQVQPQQMVDGTEFDFGYFEGKNQPLEGENQKTQQQFQIFDEMMIQEQDKQNSQSKIEKSDYFKSDSQQSLGTTPLNLQIQSPSSENNSPLIKRPKVQPGLKEQTSSHVEIIQKQTTHTPVQSITEILIIQITDEKDGESQQQNNLLSSEQQTIKIPISQEKNEDRLTTHVEEIQSTSEMVPENIQTPQRQKTPPKREINEKAVGQMNEVQSIVHNTPNDLKPSSSPKEQSEKKSHKRIQSDNDVKVLNVEVKAKNDNQKQIEKVNGQEVQVLELNVNQQLQEKEINHQLDKSPILPIAKPPNNNKQQMNKEAHEIIQPKNPAIVGKSLTSGGNEQRQQQEKKTKQLSVVKVDETKLSISKQKQSVKNDTQPNKNNKDQTIKQPQNNKHEGQQVKLDSTKDTYVKQRPFSSKQEANKQHVKPVIQTEAQISDKSFEIARDQKILPFPESSDQVTKNLQPKNSSTPLTPKMNIEKKAVVKKAQISEKVSLHNTPIGKKQSHASNTNTNKQQDVAKETNLKKQISGSFNKFDEANISYQNRAVTKKQSGIQKSFADNLQGQQGAIKIEESQAQLLKVEAKNQQNPQSNTSLQSDQSQTQIPKSSNIVKRFTNRLNTISHETYQNSYEKLKLKSQKTLLTVVDTHIGPFNTSCAFVYLKQTIMEGMIKYLESAGFVFQESQPNELSVFYQVDKLVRLKIKTVESSEINLIVFDFEGEKQDRPFCENLIKGLKL